MNPHHRAELVTMNSHSRAEALVCRFVHESQCDSYWYDDQDLFVSWLSRLQESCERSTFTSYRKWLAAYAVDLGFTDFAGQIRGVGKKARGRPSMYVKAAPPKNKALSISLSQDDVSLLGRTLLSKRGSGDRYKHGVLSITWFQMTMMTGIRPSEWKDAVLLQDVQTESGKRFSWVLEVRTAKKGISGKGGVNEKVDRRESDNRRRFVLDSWSDWQVETLKAFMNQLPHDEIEFKKQLDLVRKTLDKASVVAGMSENKIGLYTGRHVFASEVRRSSKRSRYELAALLGHSDTLNQKYYGDLNEESARAFDFELPMPWPGVALEVERQDKERFLLASGDGDH